MPSTENYNELIAQYLHETDDCAFSQRELSDHESDRLEHDYIINSDDSDADPNLVDCKRDLVQESLIFYDEECAYCLAP